MSDVLAALLDEIRALDEAATAGPWAYDSYAVVSAPHLFAIDEAAWKRAPEGCNFPKRYQCESCVDVTEENHAGSGQPFTYRKCSAPDDLYEADSVVCGVPAHHGDTAIGRHQGDAAFIARARTLLIELAEQVQWMRNALVEFAVMHGGLVPMDEVLRIMKGKPAAGRPVDETQSSTTLDASTP